jgi:hypothetical protein
MLACAYLQANQVPRDAVAEGGASECGHCSEAGNPRPAMGTSGPVCLSAMRASGPAQCMQADGESSSRGCVAGGALAGDDAAMGAGARGGGGAQPGDAHAGGPGGRGTGDADALACVLEVGKSSGVDGDDQSAAAATGEEGAALSLEWLRDVTADEARDYLMAVGGACPSAITALPDCQLHICLAQLVVATADTISPLADACHSSPCHLRLDGALVALFGDGGWLAKRHAAVCPARLGQEALGPNFDRILVVLFDLQNRILGPCLASRLGPQECRVHPAADAAAARLPCGRQRGPHLRAAGLDPHRGRQRA